MCIKLQIQHNFHSLVYHKMLKYSGIIYITEREKEREREREREQISATTTTKFIHSQMRMKEKKH